MEIFAVILVGFILPMCVLVKPIKNCIKNKENIKELFKNNKIEILLSIILMIGSLIRVACIDKMPNALNIDEASSGYDAFSILKYGVDKKGNSFPVVLYAWGSGQSVLYSYMMIPFLILFNGLTEFSTRFPMALAGIISLYVMYYLIKNIFDNKKTALIGVAFWAISPWHIMKSRWGMECNLFPDLILLAVLLLVLGLKNKKTSMQVLSFVVLGISSYSYATSYMFLPIFVCSVLGYLIYKKEISIKRAILYIGIVFVISLPLIVYLAINTFNLEQISILGVTLPKMKMNRYEEISTVFSGNLLENCINNLLVLLKLLLLQYDELDWNALPQYGLFYLISIPFFIIGVREAIKNYNKNKYSQIMNLWMISAIIVCAFCVVNVNRVNIIMIPCIYYIILGLYYVADKYKIMQAGLIIIYIASFTLFINSYFKQDFNEYFTFNSGLEEIVDYCEYSKCENIYFKYSFKEPFIYVMFYSEYNVNDYIKTVEYFSEDGIFDNVKSFGRYNFYLPEEIKENSIVVVPKSEEPNYDAELKRKVTINEFCIYEY